MSEEKAFGIYNVPIRFEETYNVLDERFTKVKVWIAHSGENRHGSIFSKELLESMIPSLSNIPILGYIAVDENGEKDFLAHEERLVEGNQLRYFGRAYGLIPTENNAHFEFRYGEDGVEREYLVCDGLLWNKFPDVKEIFDRDSGFKSQSMELLHSSVYGYKDDQGRFVYTQAKFEGACLLGEHVTPAMISSTIDRFSTSNDMQIELKEMLTEFNTYFSTINERGDDTVPTDQGTENQDLTQETPEGTLPTETPVETPVEDPQGENFEAPQETPEETPVENPEETSTKEEPEETPEETPVENPEENFEAPQGEEPKFSRTFELSHDDIRSQLYQAMDQHETFKDSWMWISKVYDSHAVVEDESGGKYFKVNYVKHENAVTIGDHEELYPMFLSANEKNTIDSSRNNFEALEQEVGELRVFKETVETAEKEEKLSQYSNTLSEEEYTSVKNNLKNFSINDIEKEIGFILLKKNHFSVQPDSSTSRVGATNTNESNPYGSASVYFSK